MQLSALKFNEQQRWEAAYSFVNFINMEFYFE
jgi:hypothetical protein